MHFFRRAIQSLTPPPEWQVAVIILLGILGGIAVYIFRASNAAAYLSDRPETCINCHVMVPEYSSWKQSSHARDAVCMDCHVPHDNIFNKYYFKMKDGTRHAAIFTMHAEPQVIRIKEDGKAVVQANCLRCHANVMQEVHQGQVTHEKYMQGEGKLCWDCHREVPHGRVHGLSSAPFAQTPETPRLVPKWLEKMWNKK